MVDTRNIVSQYGALGGRTYHTSRGAVTLPFVYSEEFLFSDGLAIIKEEVHMCCAS